MQQVFSAVNTFLREEDGGGGANRSSFPMASSSSSSSSSSAAASAAAAAAAAALGGSRVSGDVGIGFGGHFGGEDLLGGGGGGGGGGGASDGGDGSGGSGGGGGGGGRLLTTRLHKRIKTYTVVPLTPEIGVMEWVKNTIPIGSYLTARGGKPGAHDRFRPDDWKHAACRKKMTQVSS